MRDEPWRVNQVEGSLAHDLVGDVKVPALCVVRRRGQCHYNSLTDAVLGCSIRQALLPDDLSPPLRCPRVALGSEAWVDAQPFLAAQGPATVELQRCPLHHPELPGGVWLSEAVDRPAAR